jgi:hypothetical protein
LCSAPAASSVWKPLRIFSSSGSPTLKIPTYWNLYFTSWTNLQPPRFDVCDENRSEMYFLGNVMALAAPSLPLLWLIRLLAPVDTAAVYPI